MEDFNNSFNIDDFITNNDNTEINYPTPGQEHLSSWGIMTGNTNDNQIYGSKVLLDSPDSLESPTDNVTSFDFNNTKLDTVFENDLYQIISNSPSLSSSSSSNEIQIIPELMPATSTSNTYTEFNPSNASSNSSMQLSMPSKLDFDDILFNESPLPIDSPDFNTFTSNNIQSNNGLNLSTTRTSSPIITQNPLSLLPALSSTTSSSSLSFRSPGEQSSQSPESITYASNSSTPSTSQNKKRSSLDSRLSLQRLGDILKTSSLEETIKMEKFILDIFVKELGFPLGHKTWIRDTNEKYRHYLLEELYKRVQPSYPEMTRSLLETVIKRAAYSMMQGRLRKQRRAASKAANNGKKKAKKGQFQTVV